MIIKKIAFILFYLNLVFISSAYSQKYNAIDSIILKYPNFGNTEILAKRINTDFASEYDRARAIYSWIAININYDVKKFLNPSASKRISFKDQSDYERELQKYVNDRIKKTFRSKKGVCEDFSLLYEQIGTLSGLKVKVVRGNAKVHLSDIGKKRLYTNHAWNAVEINGKWILLDATWGGGSLDYETMVDIKWFTPIYFDMNPKYFNARHFPESEDDDFKIDKEVYLNGPLIYDKMIEKDCEILFPKSGVIVANEGDKILFKIKNLSEFNDLAFLNKNNQKFQITYLKEENNVLEFEVLYKRQMGQFITLYRYQDALVSFKIVSK